MRLFVKIQDASMVNDGESQFPIKGQVVDVPDTLGTSLLLFDEYEVYTEQVKLHKDFIAFDKASDKATAEAEIERLEQEAKDAEAKRLADEAEEKRLAEEEEAKRLEEEKTNENTPIV